MDTSATATPVSQPPLATQLQPSQSQVSITADNLRTFSDSLTAFQQCFNDLQRHINSIQTSINTMLLPPQPLPASSSSPAVATPASAPAPEPEPSWESDPSEDLEEEEEVQQEEKEVEGGEGEGEDEDEEVNSLHVELKLPPSELKSPLSELKSPRSELEIFCETMDHCGLRKYMTTHISNFRGLREEVRKALRLSPNPATLVFNCIGKFYITAGKKFANESPLGRGRKAKVLLLECFLLMIGICDKGVEIENWVKEEAEQTALAWLERMKSEGGGKLQEIDARGLLFFIGGFGIPDQFTNANIRTLLQVSNLKWSFDALKRSNALMAKLPEIIEEMVANKAVIKAVHIVYSVGMQDKFNPRTLLTTFIRESKKLFDNMNGSQSAHQGNIVAKGKYLGDLRSIIKCLRNHEVDPSKVLPGWEISKRIASLEKEIAEFNKQIPDKKIAHGSHKRKKDGTVWLSNKEVKHSHSSNPWPPQHQRVASNVISNNILFEGGGTAGHNYGYFMPPLVLHGPVAGSIHENVGYSLAGPVRGVAIGGPGAGISASANSIHAGMDVVPQGVPYAGGHRGNRVDSIPGQIGSHTGQFYGSTYRPSTPNTIAGDIYRPAPFMESSKGLPNTIPGDSSGTPLYLEVSPGLPNTIPSNAYRPAPYMESSKGLTNTIPGDSNRTPPYLEVSPGLPNTIPSNAYRPVPYMESSKGLPNTIPGDANRPSPKLEGSMELPNTINGDAYRPPPYLEGSMGLPNTKPPPHQFVNTVPATELNQSSGSKAVDAHPSSSLYKQR
ncbi:uncharacterized protein LOC125872400 [Solanum stenotomum]|uniref:uncharacterized protein LOC125872400 n=1 Tax=Solanum stenotomum TaxID=172797 RepID=UPI0020D0E116|nr:uncharacterized protein LOC125872400 [Solanum stenotomum]